MTEERLLNIYEEYLAERDQMIAAGERLTQKRALGYFKIWVREKNQDVMKFKTNKQIAIQFIDSEDRIDMNLMKGINEAFTSGAFENQKFMREISRVYEDIKVLGLGKNDPPISSFDEAYQDIMSMKALQDQIQEKFVNDENYRRAFLKLWYNAGGQGKDYWFNPSPKETSEE